MRFELTPRDEIVTVKDFRHDEYPLISKQLGWRVGVWDMLRLQNRQVNGTWEANQPLKIRGGAKYDST